MDFALPVNLAAWPILPGTNLVPVAVPLFLLGDASAVLRLSNDSWSTRSERVWRSAAVRALWWIVSSSMRPLNGKEPV